MQKAVIVLVVLIVFVNAVVLGFGLFLSTNPTLSGKVSGAIGLVILQQPLDYEVFSPENKSYHFEIGQPMTIDLNASADFEVDTWTYTLTDLAHNSIVNQSVIFVPNTTISAVRKSNKLTVRANNSNGVNAEPTDIIFFVTVNNSAPILNPVNKDIFVCEGGVFTYFVGASDVDEDDLSMSLSPPGNPFFITPTHFVAQSPVESEIFSGRLTKSDVGRYPRTIAIADNGNPPYSDSTSFNITVIEINNPPVLENIPTQTIYTVGDNSTFNYLAAVTDVESGNQNSGNLSFNLSFLSGTQFFTITQSGVMIAQGSDELLGNYEVQVCVTDTALQSPHANISLCGQSGTNQTSCDTFSLTVTNANRPPTITDNIPSELAFTSPGTSAIQFEVTNYDPDGGQTDTYWYVDEQLKKYTEASLNSSFVHQFGCGIGGTHSVRAEISDGLQNDSVQWNITVETVTCPVTEPAGGSGGSGGGGGGPGPTTQICLQKWGCNSWSICQNAHDSLAIGAIAGSDYRDITSECSSNGWSESDCGFQIRTCSDVNQCNLTTEIGKPTELQACLFSRAPSCSDGIKNCHSEDCEFLIDCGGPCKPCPTCSDRIRNQGEDETDCGGPCPACPPKVPLVQRKPVIYTVIIVMSFLSIIVLFQVVRILQIRREIRSARFRRQKFL